MFSLTEEISKRTENVLSMTTLYLYVRTPANDTESGQLCEQIKINSDRIPSVLGGKSPKELIGKEITVENVVFKGRSIYSRIYATV